MCACEQEIHANWDLAGSQVLIKAPPTTVSIQGPGDLEVGGHTRGHRPAVGQDMYCKPRIHLLDHNMKPVLHLQQLLLATIPALQPFKVTFSLPSILDGLLPANQADNIRQAILRTETLLCLARFTTASHSIRLLSTQAHIPDQHPYSNKQVSIALQTTVTPSSITRSIQLNNHGIRHILN